MPNNNQSDTNSSSYVRPMRTETLPWHKQFWPWFIIFFPALAVVAGIATIIIAVKTDDGLVEENYYKAGLAINKTIEDEANAKAMGLSAHIKIVPESHQLHLKLTGIKKVEPKRLILNLIHPTIKNRDISVPLQLGNNAEYSGFLTTLPEDGRWYVTLVPESKQWRISSEIHFPIVSSWELTTKPAKK